MSPSNKKGGSGLTRNPPKVSVTTKTDIHQQPNRKTGPRHVPGQLPLVRAATVHEPFPGQKRAMVLPDDVCPRCGFKRLHWSNWPAPALLQKRCRCGCGYELTLYPVKSKRRSLRKAAV